MLMQVENKKRGNKQGLHESQDVEVPSKLVPMRKRYVLPQKKSH